MVNKFSKFTVLLFVLVLSITGTGKYSYGNQLSSELLNSHHFLSAESLSESRPNAFCINPASEIVISPVSSFPAPQPKNDTPGSGALPFLPESAIQNPASQYISRSVEIYPGLTNVDIIFPFHYFW